MEMKEAYTKNNEMNRNRYELYLSKFLMGYGAFNGSRGFEHIQTLKAEYLNKSIGMLELMYSADVITMEEYGDLQASNRLYADNKANETFSKHLDLLRKDQKEEE